MGVDELNLALLVGTSVGNSVGEVVLTAHKHCEVLLHELVLQASTFNTSRPRRSKQPKGLYEPYQFEAAWSLLKPSSLAASSHAATVVMYTLHCPDILSSNLFGGWLLSLASLSASRVSGAESTDSTWRLDALPTFSGARATQLCSHFRSLPRRCSISNCSSSVVG